MRAQKSIQPTPQTSRQTTGNRVACPSAGQVDQDHCVNNSCAFKRETFSAWDRPPDVEFRVLGKPLQWARARINRQRRHFTPDAQRKQATCIRTAFVEAAPLRAPWTGPVRIEVEAVFSRPKKGCWEGKRHVIRPDRDNLGKIVADALNGVAFVDDSQIDDGRDIKRYGDHPETIVRLWFDDQFPKPEKPSRRKAVR